MNKKTSVVIQEQQKPESSHLVGKSALKEK
jgi:hypothetical protein